MSEQSKAARMNGTGPSAGYRLLQDREVIRSGDEFLADSAETWVPVPIDGGDAVWQTWMVGTTYDPGFHRPFRRPIDTDNAKISGGTPSAESDCWQNGGGK